MNKEQIYDEQIAPLMTQIINLCNASQISMVSSFHVPNDDDPDLMCTTMLLRKEWGTPHCLYRAGEAMKPTVRSALMITTENGDGTKTMSAFL